MGTSIGSLRALMFVSIGVRRQRGAARSLDGDGEAPIWLVVPWTLLALVPEGDDRWRLVTPERRLLVYPGAADYEAAGGVEVMGLQAAVGVEGIPQEGSVGGVERRFFIKEVGLIGLSAKGFKDLAGGKGGDGSVSPHGRGIGCDAQES